ncbi:MAG: hypothetical protein JXQ66_07800 [Campylobacterales bacterium]|nr:hypothetical protein [Campylobacterales bacterium]
MESISMILVIFLLFIYVVSVFILTHFYEIRYAFFEIFSNLGIKFIGKKTKYRVTDFEKFEQKDN